MDRSAYFRETNTGNLQSVHAWGRFQVMPSERINRATKAQAIATHILTTYLPGYPQTMDNLVKIAARVDLMTEEQWDLLLSTSPWGHKRASDGKLGASAKTRKMVTTALLERAAAVASGVRKAS